jgi:predicted negative regulator of RcsB-dependent stress response
MTIDPSVENQTKDAAAPVAPAPDHAAQLQSFWEKNRSIILGACAAILLAIVARGGWDYFSASRERQITADYAAVASQPDKLAKFAQEHPGHALGGVAWLRLADEKYSAGDFKTAAANYQKAADALQLDVLQARAKLGGAMSQVAGGDKAAGESTLKALSADTKQVKAVRAEATYHLAALANEAGKTDEVLKYAEEISKIDPTGVWAQRAFVLRASLAQGKAADAAPGGISFKPGGE